MAWAEAQHGAATVLCVMDLSNRPGFCRSAVFWLVVPEKVVKIGSKKGRVPFRRSDQKRKTKNKANLKAKMTSRQANNSHKNAAMKKTDKNQVGENSKTNKTQS